MNTAVNLLKDILIFIIDALIWLIALVKSALTAVWEWLLSVPLSEKIIVFTFIPAFFAVAMPSARFPIFETFFDVTNPLAVYLNRAHYASDFILSRAYCAGAQAWRQYRLSGGGDLDTRFRHHNHGPPLQYDVLLLFELRRTGPLSGRHTPVPNGVFPGIAKNPCPRRGNAYHR
jgi:hypothetical protein